MKAILWNKSQPGYWATIGIILLCFLSRLPQLLSPELILDGDECVAGLMAKHFIEGKEIPVFFHGQAYGFSFIETALISLFYLLAGMHTLSVKLPMLLLWTGGIVFFYKTLKNLNAGNNLLPFLITLIFVFSPSWALWSMKARGGYLTAFFLSSLLSFLLFGEYYKRSAISYCIGVLLVIIYQSQRLWLPGLFPFLVYELAHKKNEKVIFKILAGIAVSSVIFLWLKTITSNYWSPKVFEFTYKTFMHDLKDLPPLLFDHLNGYYFLYYIYEAPFVCRAFSVFFICLFVAAAIFAFSNHRKHQLFVASVISVFFTLCYTLFLTEHAPRYLIPLTGFALLSLFLMLSKLDKKVLNIALCSCFVAVGIPSLISFRNYTFYPAKKKEVTACVSYLKEHDIQYVFSNDGLLEWQIMFYSGEKIICRESNNKDRYPEYVQKVNEAYLNNSSHTAVVDNTTDLKSISPDSTANTTSHFYIMLHPSAEVIRDMEFQF